MASRGKRPKGQPPISSFFARAPAPPPASSTRGGHLALPLEDSVKHELERNPSSAQEPPPKRHKTLAPTDAPVPDAQPLDSNAGQRVAGSGSGIRVASGTGCGAGIPERNPVRHRVAQERLVGGGEGAGGGKGVANGGNAAGGLKFTPLERQVARLKEQYPNVVLIIEVGYKMRFFGDDAEIASKVCNIYSYPDRNFLTASFPVPRLPIYVRRLVEAGHRVGVVRQTETAAAKAVSANKYSVFERRLTGMYTRATLQAGEVFEAGMEYGAGVGDDGAYGPGCNHLLCVVEGDGRLGVVAVETCTGDVRWGVCSIDAMDHDLQSVLMRVTPSELLMVDPINKRSAKMLEDFLATMPGGRVEHASGAKYEEGRVVHRVTELCSAVESFDASQIVGSLPRLVLQALCAAEEYLRPLGVSAVMLQWGAFTPIASDAEMELSANALRQLEILHNNVDGKVKGSLLHLMDHTRTPFGSRLLCRWLSHPLTDWALIRDRLEAVDELARAQSTGSGPLASLGDVLSKLPDLERGITRMLHKTAGPSEFARVLRALHSLSDSLPHSAAPSEVDANDCGVRSSMLRSLLASACSAAVHELSQRLLSAIDVRAALQNDKLGMFQSRERFPDVVTCREGVKAAEAGLQDLLPRLSRQIGVPCLQYVSIQNQGDFLVELPSDFRGSLPNWEKVCSTKKVNRYHPPEVKLGISRLEQARDRLEKAGSVAWAGFISEFSADYCSCRAAVQALAALDVLQGFAVLAQSSNYCRPQFVGPADVPMLSIRNGRHPVLDGLLGDGAVPNDVLLGGQGPCSAIVTGPNMGGKSCYIKQAALTVVMAQVGSFVPAESACLHVFDASLVRMGASDNIRMGRSTFLEELSDASHILAAATRRSLVIIDELGRGTSTHDGVAIASAALRHLVASTQCATLFVTHYPEVAAMGCELPGRLVAHHMAYLQEGGNEAVCGDSRCSRVMHQESETAGPKVQGRNAQVSHEPAKAAGSRHRHHSFLHNKAAGTQGDQEMIDGLDEAGVTRSGHMPRLVFLYRLVSGPADDSFGLNVARMAALPERVVDRAAHKALEMRGKEEARRQVGRSCDAQGCINDVCARLSSLLGTAGSETGVAGVRDFLRWLRR